MSSETLKSWASGAAAPSAASASVISTAAGRVAVIAAAALLALAVAKGREILLHYLELDRAGPGWRLLMTGWLVLLCGAILLVTAAGALGWIGPR